MPEPNQMGRIRNTPRNAILFYIITILLAPVSVVGYVLWIITFISQRNKGVSATAQAPLSARWLQHQFGIRHDQPAHKLLMVLPGGSSLAMLLVLGPLVFAHRMSGYIPPSLRYPFQGEITLQNQGTARQTIYDGVVARYLPSLKQFVILGAGFDTRALRLPHDIGVRSFEVDTPKTQQVKKEMLRRAHVDASGVTFVAADFEHDSWLERLVASGFDPRPPALFLWEGVTPYLERAAVEATLRTIASTAQGSVVAFDVFTTEVLTSSAPYILLVRASLKAGGEPLRFGIDSTPPLVQRMSELLQSCGLSLVEHRTIGPSSGTKRPLGGYAVAVVGTTNSEV